MAEVKSAAPPRQTNRRWGRESIPFKTYIRPSLRDEVAEYAVQNGTSIALLVDDALEEFMRARRGDRVA